MRAPERPAGRPSPRTRSRDRAIVPVPVGRSCPATGWLPGGIPPRLPAPPPGPRQQRRPLAVMEPSGRWRALGLPASAWTRARTGDPLSGKLGALVVTRSTVSGSAPRRSSRSGRPPSIPMAAGPWAGGERTASASRVERPVGLDCGPGQNRPGLCGLQDSPGPPWVCSSAGTVDLLPCRNGPPAPCRADSWPRRRTLRSGAGPGSDEVCPGATPVSMRLPHQGPEQVPTTPPRRRSGSTVVRAWHPERAIGPFHVERPGPVGAESGMRPRGPNPYPRLSVRALAR